jgi:hypothetical protein
VGAATLVAPRFLAAAASAEAAPAPGQRALRGPAALMKDLGPNAIPIIWVRG